MSRRSLTGPAAVRTAAFAALALFGAVRWSGIVSPAPAGRMALALGLFLAGALALRVIAPAPRAARLAVAALGVLAILLLCARLFGVPRALLAPAHWDALAAHIGRGVAALPGASTPYSELDPWPRLALLLTGVALLALAAALALRPGAASLRARALAAVPLLVLAVVPDIVLPAQREMLLGLVLFGLLAAFLWAEHLSRRALPAALALLTFAGATGAATMPALDRAEPALDYQGLADKLHGAAGERFDWNHHYGPLHWPAGGAEVLRVRARTPVYLKAENLDEFDGLHWVRAPLNGPAAPEAELPAGIGSLPRRWRERVRVSLVDLRTSDVIGAGSTLAVRRSPSPLLPGTSPGTWSTTRPLSSGDSYEVDVFTPHPSRRTLATAGTDYAPFLESYRQLTLPRRVRGRLREGGAQVLVPPFGSGTAPVVQQEDGGPVGGEGPLLRSPYARTFALARKLADASATPYAFARRVQRYLGEHARYTEAAPARAVPLDAFLFRDHLGYCQQFSGAMALLLRLGGVPARVSAGFAPGVAGDRRGERIIRDTDAHSWVEVWFPGSGWVTFDPTPGVVQSALTAGGVGIGRTVPRRPGEQSRQQSARDTAAAVPVARPPRGHGHGTTAVVPAVLAALTLAGLTLLLWRRHRRSGGRVQRGDDPLVSELERALRRTGRPAAPGTTLAALEQRFAGSPDAALYLRALRAARYGESDVAPTAASRRALRAELARGLGPAGRARALWALPPRLHS